MYRKGHPVIMIEDLAYSTELKFNNSRRQVRTDWISRFALAPMLAVRNASVTVTGNMSSGVRVSGQVDRTRRPGTRILCALQHQICLHVLPSRARKIQNPHELPVPYCRQMRNTERGLGRIHRNRLGIKEFLGSREIEMSYRQNT